LYIINKRTLLKALTGIFVVILIFTTGCGKDDNKTPDNQFTYNGETYDLSQGLIAVDTIVEGQLYGYWIFFLSDGYTIYWNDQHTMIDSVKGKGEMIQFGMVSENASGPADGNYDHTNYSKKSLAGVPDPFSWGFGYLAIGYSQIGDDHVGEMIKIIDGTIGVKNTGTNKYEFTLNTTTDKENLALNAVLKFTMQSFTLQEMAKSASLSFPEGMVK